MTSGFWTEPVFWKAVAAACLCGGLCAYLGVFLILKRVVFVGVGLSQAAALGVAAAFLLGFPHLAGGFLLTMGTALLFWRLLSRRTAYADGWIAFAYCFCAALSIILIAKNPRAEVRELDLISGNLLYATPSEMVLMGLLAIGVTVLHLRHGRELVFLSFDPESAHATGVPISIRDFLLYLIMALVIGVAMKACGTILLFGSLVIPPLAAVTVVRRGALVFKVSLAVTLTGAIAGVVTAWLADLPAAPSIVAWFGAVLLVLLGLKRVL